jgi:outer membrane protein assembly factor BamE (lipoprotein component of BamABCDE complex)
MTRTQVVTILGEPEEIRPLYEPKIWNAKRIGTTYWFIIERRKPSGSVNERAEKLVRVAFDLNQLVTRVDHWGF